MTRKSDSNVLRGALFVAVASIAAAYSASAGETHAATPTKPAAATKPAAVPVINVQQLAVAERAIEFCTPIDPDSAKRLKDQVATLLKGSSSDAVTQARGSEAYKAAYSSMDGFIGQIDARNAKVACANTARRK